VRDSRPFLIALIVLVAAVGIFYQRKDAARRRAATSDSTVAADSFPDADRDGAPDALPVRRLAAGPDAGPALEALAAAGGYAAWQAGPAFGVDIEEAWFDDRGLIREERTSRLVMSRRGPPRFVLASSDGRSRLGIGSDGPWMATKGANGLWAPGAPAIPGAAELRRVARRTSWLHRLPFILGDVDVQLEAPPGVDPADSLAHLVVHRPAAPGDSSDARIELGFDRARGHLVLCRFPDAAPALLVRFDDFRAEATGRPVRPHRWSVFEADSASGEPRRLLEVRLGTFDWDATPAPADFEPPVN
jgi:hypothetical protein